MSTFNCWFCHQPLSPPCYNIGRFDWSCLPCAQNNDMETVEYIVLKNPDKIIYANFKFSLKSKRWHVNLSENTTSVSLLDPNQTGINWVFHNLPGQILSPQNAKTRLPIILLFQ